MTPSDPGDTGPSTPGPGPTTPGVASPTWEVTLSRGAVVISAVGAATTTGHPGLPTPGRALRLRPPPPPLPYPSPSPKHGKRDCGTDENLEPLPPGANVILLQQRSEPPRSAAR
nr:uncharacterized protein LOC127304448 [Lolium perenne]